MLPPETEDTLVSLGRIPNSCSLRIAPRWKSVARNPPPDRLNPTELGSFALEGMKSGNGTIHVLSLTVFISSILFSAMVDGLRLRDLWFGAVRLNL